ncbi:uncharacterized protein LOC125871861 isoform X3 [Solanum stenotomum]|uniref:uncharacterized protein LOC125871861 isoform X3 n=1 Tax=Solanum stenotomum TaxID=172797 RepID=UPI0020D10E77|nr:uncharacterized protein LOC125871861 isoform X3 [Solanum stenotomum]XP_049408519.1 uncharacterized protein LOC125871861 isoform X3 [Solanum stenotomum]
MSHSLSTVALPLFATVITAAKQPRQRPNAKTQSGKQKTTTTITPGVPAATAMKTTSGFNSRNKEPTWQCVQNCGACCKLEKGPNFPSAEEIFDDPSDIEIVPTFVGLNRTSLRHCMGLKRKSSTRKLADTIKAVYGSTSKELENFNAAIWSST